MPLLKRDNSSDRLASEAVVLDLGDLRQQAEKLRAQARAEADRILEQARAEAEMLTAEAAQKGHDAGYQQGYDEGLAAGRKQGHAEALQKTREQLNQLQQAWVDAAQQWDSERRTMLLDARQSVLELAIAIAERICKRAPRVDRSLVVDQVAAALEQITRPADVQVRIHPDDRPLLSEALPELIKAGDTCEHVHLVDDSQIEPGGCKVTYGKGTIDATLATQLDRIVQALLPGHAPSNDPANPAEPGGNDTETNATRPETTEEHPDNPDANQPPPETRYDR